MDKEIKGRLPPFTEALINHTKEKQFPFDTPGHHGGDFYNLTEEGKAFTRSNRICCQALLSENDLVLLDRNSHKSVYQGALLQCSAIPVCLDSLRLKNGIIAGIDKRSLNEKHLRKEAARLVPESKNRKRPYRLAVVQLATYHGFMDTSSSFP